MKTAILMIAFLMGMATTPFELDKEKMAEFSWHTQTVDLGEIELGSKTPVTFEFVNTGTVPLVISTAKSSCGCTVASYTKEAILPGEKGVVEAVYSANSIGSFRKTIALTANTEDGGASLKISGSVVTAAR